MPSIAGDDLMASDSPDTDPVTASLSPSTTPPPPRNPQEDEDTSLTRKRPRLDSGASGAGTHVPAVTSSAAPNKHHAAASASMGPLPAPTTPRTSPTPDQQLEMTIRSQPQLSSHTEPTAGPDAAGSAPPSPSSGSVTMDEAQPNSPVVIADDEYGNDTAGSASPGVINVEFTHDIATTIFGEPKHTTATDHHAVWGSFPYIGDGDALAALNSMYIHLKGQEATEVTTSRIVSGLRKWFSEVPLNSNIFFTREPHFWAEMGTVTYTILVWGKFVHDHYTAESLKRFIDAYFGVCISLMRIDRSRLRASQAPQSEQDLMTYRHLPNLQAFLRPDLEHLQTNAVFAMGRGFHINMHAVGHELRKSYLGCQNHFVLFHLLSAADGRTTPSAYLQIATPILNIMLGFADLSSDLGFSSRKEFYQNLLHLSQPMERLLQDPAKMPDPASTREAIRTMERLLLFLCHKDPDIAAELTDKILVARDESVASEPDDDPDHLRMLFDLHDPTDRAFLIAKVWQLRVLKSYLIKGRMELRVLSITAMAEIYTSTFTTYKNTLENPVILYLANYLVREQIVEYLVSVNSHPQIIQRSRNVPSFLAVTNHWSKKQTDACWHALCHAQDPRFLSAIGTMLSDVAAYVDTQELCYFFHKMFHLPVEGLTSAIFDLFEAMVTHVLESPFPRMPHDWSTVEPTAKPWHVCMRIIQDTAPCRHATPLMAQLHRDAFNLLEKMLPFLGHRGTELELLFTECVSEIGKGTPKATGSVHALGLLSVRQQSEALHMYREKPDIIRSIFEELCAFVERERLQGSYPQYEEALDYRVDLIRFLVKHLPELMPVELYPNIWDHTVGKYALENGIRDRIWHKFASFNKDVPQNEFCKGLIDSYVRNLEREYFSRGLLHFVASYSFPSDNIATEASNGAIRIPGAELLWHLIVNAPENTIENDATELLASRYAMPPASTPLEKMEDAHAALVEKCTEELMKEYRTLRSGKSDPDIDESESMDLTLSDVDRTLAEHRLERIVTFERLLLKRVRANLRFSPQIHREVQARACNRKGTHITITYNSNSPQGKDSLPLGTDNTLHELETLLCQATGYEQVNIFFGGKRLNPRGCSTEVRLCALGLSSDGHMLVQKASGSDVCQPLRPQNQGLSAFEAALMNYFETLFTSMDSSDHVSEVIFGLLNDLPTDQRIAEEITSGKAKTEDIFPPGKPFQAKYAAYALGQKLVEHLDRSTISDCFLLNAIRLLSDAIVDPRVISEEFSSPQDLSLASVLVGNLSPFLKERPRENISDRYFLNAELLTERLLYFLTATLPDSSGISAVQLAHDCPVSASCFYEAIVDATLHSQAVWTAFAGREDFTELHRTLLLATTSANCRVQAPKLVRSVCGGGLSETAPVSQSQYRATFWPTIMAIIPDILKYPGRSKDFLRVAEEVFRKWAADEESSDDGSCDEVQLRLCFSSWSKLLLEHQHEESVGRDEVDHVVLGLTKLLKDCVLELKSFKKKLEAGDVIRALFHKYLFPPRVVDVEDETNGPQLPVLESKTRKQLYDLLTSMADDRATHEALLNVARGVASYDESVALISHVDNWDELRSSTGYVGLFNPQALCYMNSLLFQLFMNVNFRRFILGLPIIDADGSQKLLSEMQKLFAELQNSARKSVDPRPFAACVKGLDGEPINVTVQMDADEFANMLFDQLEGQMLSAETKQEFRSFFGGKMTTQIKSKDCEHVSETVENFFAVQCDVLGKSTLEESLQSFVEGDVMEGDNKYRCSDCGEKYVDAVKRTCLKEVPDHLLFNLKRFDFDLETLNRRKINDRFEFPMEIDMNKYHIDHLSGLSAPTETDMFELVGVLVHMGSSESGHYYSYIRERPCEPGQLDSRWLEFNDRSVSEFDPKNIANQAFGGQAGFTPNQQKSYSAYMLFYQRKAAMAKDHEDFIGSRRGRPAKVPMPPSLESSISDNNQASLRQYCLQQPEYTRFLEHVVGNARNVNGGVCSEDHGLESQALRVLLEHSCLTLSQSKQLLPLDAMLDHIRRLTESCRKCCKFVLHWLATDQDALESCLLASGAAKCRSASRCFLQDTLQSLREEDPAAYGIDAGEDMEAGSEPLESGILIGVVRKLQQLWQESLWKWPKSSDDFYLTLSEICHFGRAEIGVLLNEGFLADTLAMYLHRTRVELPAEYRLLFDAMSKSKRNLLNKASELLYLLLSNIDMRLPLLKGHPSYGERLAHCDTNGKLPLTETEYHYLACLDSTDTFLALLDRMLDVGTGGKLDRTAPSEIVTWLVEHDRPNKHFHRCIATTIVDALQSADPAFLAPFIEVVLPYCKVSRDREQVRIVLETLMRWAKKSETDHACAAALLAVFSRLYSSPNACGERSHWFVLLLLGGAHCWAVPLLQSDNDEVRLEAAPFVKRLLSFEPEGMDLHDIYHARYESIRLLLPNMVRRIVTEYHAGTNRTWMVPLLDTCHSVAVMLHNLVHSDDEEMQEYRKDADSRLVRTYQDEVQGRLNVWIEEVPGTPLSDDGEFLSENELAAYGSLADVQGVDGLDPEEYSDSDGILEVEE